MNIGGGLVILGLLLWLGSWLAHEPFWPVQRDFGAIQNPPRWVRVVTGAKDRLVIPSLTFEIWGWLMALLGLFVLAQAFDSSFERLAIIAVVFGGGITAAAISAFIWIVGRLREARGTEPRSERP